MAKFEVTQEDLQLGYPYKHKWEWRAFRARKINEIKKLAYLRENERHEYNKIMELKAEEKAEVNPDDLIYISTAAVLFYCNAFYITVKESPSSYEEAIKLIAEKRRNGESDDELPPIKPTEYELNETIDDFEYIAGLEFALNEAKQISRLWQKVGIVKPQVGNKEYREFITGKDPVFFRVMK